MSIDMGVNSPHATAIYELSVQLERGYYEGDDMQGPEYYHADQRRLDAKFDADINHIISNAGYDPVIVRAWAAQCVANHPAHQWVAFGQRMREIVFILRLFRGMEKMP
jgi:hypothetical protein